MSTGVWKVRGAYPTRCVRNGNAARRYGLAGILGVVCVALALSAHAFTFYFPGTSEPRDEPPPGWPFRPPTQDNARGQPPVYQPGPPPGPSVQMQPPPRYPSPYPGGYPTTRPWPPAQPSGPWSAPYSSGRPQPSAPPRIDRPPRLELEVAQTQPYLMENVLIRARLISDDDLATATPEPPSTDLALWQRLEGPITRLRNVSGRQEVLTEFVLILRPLRVGDIEVPPVAIAGHQADRHGKAGARFALESKPIPLQVRPAMSSVSPWLPLSDLSLQGSLDVAERVEPGQPVTLVLQIDATGATGDQLPSLEPQLRTADLPIYREQTLTRATLSKDGERLEGQRIEYYTLIPQKGGRVELPELQLAWWNIETGQREIARMPIRTLGVTNETGGIELPAGIGGGAWLWLPVAGLILLLLGYWAGVWLQPGRRGPVRRGPGLLARLGGIGSRIATRTSTWLGQLGQYLDPRPWLARLRPRLKRTLPPGLRLGLAVHKANREKTPTAWFERLQTQVSADLSWNRQSPGTLGTLGTQLPPFRMSEQLVRLRPAANRGRLETLMRELEAALYGGQDIDFPRWKRRIGREVGLAGIHPWRGGLVVHRADLPPLNPHSVS